MANTTLPAMSKAAAQRGLNILFDGLDDLMPGLGRGVELALTHHFVSQGATLQKKHLRQAVLTGRNDLAMACLNAGVQADSSIAKGAMVSQQLTEAMIGKGLKLTFDLVVLGLCYDNRAILRRYRSYERKQALVDEALFQVATCIAFGPERAKTLVMEHNAKMPKGRFAEFCSIGETDGRRDEVGAFLVLNGANYKDTYEGSSAYFWAKHMDLPDTVNAIERMLRAETIKDGLEQVAAKTRKGVKTVEPAKRQVL